MIQDEDISENDEVANNRLLPISLLAGLTGFILGPIPSIVYSVISAKAGNITGEVTGFMFQPLLVATPLLIYLFNKLFKGGRGLSAVIVTAAFSLVGAYLTVLYCFAATTTIFDNESFLQIPIRTFTWLGSGSYFSITERPAAYAYPLLFSALGVAIAALLMRSKDGFIAEPQ